MMSLICELGHANPALKRKSRLFCGIDHYRCASFHFEVENNSLQTFNPRR
jgi:hypothetical protein